MLATNRSAGFTPEVNLRELVICIPQASANKVAHSDVTRSTKIGYQWLDKKDLVSFNNFIRRNRSFSMHCNPKLFIGGFYYNEPWITMHKQLPRKQSMEIDQM